ncbi:MAG: NCS2 family permease [Alphaproteobacteria bacterium]
MLEKYFGLSAQGTNVRTEVLAGVTTFMTMAYIVLVNPLILSDAGLPIAGVAAATCVAAGIGSILMGLVANYPIALAPGMGLNAYFTYTVVKGMGVPWETALGCVLISGLVFLALTLAGVRKIIVEAVPRPLFAAIAAGIGLFIAFIGLKGAGLVVANPATTVTLGDLKSPMTLLSLGGLALTGALMAWRVRAAVLIGVLGVTVTAFVLHLTPFKPGAYDLAALTTTAFKADLPAALGLGAGGLSTAILEIIFVFLFVDFFDNLGTLVAVTKRAGLQGPDGNIPRLNRILLADSIATIVGATAGTSTTVSYIESATGVAAGGRTGLTAVVTGILFLVTLFLAPYVQLIPAAATAPALILVGGMMIAPLAETDWADPVVAIPAFLTLTIIPLTFSIANGLAFGIVSYAALRVLKSGPKREDIALYVLAALFIARFAWTAAA